MREYIGTSDIANTIMMLRAAFSGTIAVVEGTTDSRLYGKFMDKKSTEIVVAHSKDNVKHSVKEVCTKRKMDSVLGIIDNDLDRINGRKHVPPIFSTDTRDSENMMFFSSAFDSVMQEYGDQSRISVFERRNGSVRDAVLNASYPIGLLMNVSSKHGFGLSFKDLDLDMFIDRRTLSCDVERLIRYITGKNPNGPDKDLIMKAYSAENKYRSEDICRGHDITAVLAFGLRNIFGSYNAKNITDSQLAGALRLSYTKEDMLCTALYADSDKWCSEQDICLWSIKG